jgi:ADP-heptose:LPS heptosyltransferase
MKRHDNFDNIKNIVVLRTDRIGEVLLATPVIYALKKKFPNANIAFVTSDYARDIIADRMDISNVVVFDTIEKRPVFKAGISLAKTLKRLSCDMAIVLNPHKSLHLAVFLAGIKYRVGFDRKWGFLLNIKTKDLRDNALMHEADYNLELLRLVDIYEKAIPAFMPVLSQSSYRISGLLADKGITGSKKIVAIHPGTSNPDKLYPADSFREIIRGLIKTNMVDIIITGSKDDKALCEKIKSGLGNGVYDFSGLLNLKELAALLKASDIFITNDNGPMHIADAVGTKVLALFNKDAIGSNPTRWAPRAAGHIVLFDSFRDIAPESILKHAIKLLGL